MRIAVVTGAAKRIGRGIAQLLLESGFYVIAHANNSIDELKSWVAYHPQRHRVVGFVKADLSTESGQESFITQVKEKCQAVELLVHNASTFWPEPFIKINRSSFSNMLAVNLEAPFFITQGLYHHLSRGQMPSVIHIVDAMWNRPTPKYSHYSSSKAGLTILTRALASELAPKIRVNAVAPGAILFQNFHSEKNRKRTVESIPFKSLGDPEDVAQAVLYLSQKAPYVTGEIIVVDGGRSIV